MNRRLLSPDPAEGEAPKDQSAPKSPAAVKSTKTGKTPREIELEKKLSVLEDEVGTLRAVQGAPPKAKPAAAPKETPEAKTAPATGGFFADVERDIWSR